MKLTGPFLFSALVGVAGLAFAQQAITDPTVKARSDAMKVIGASMKTLGDMAGGKVPFDAGAAQAAVTAVGEKAGQIPVLFEPQASDPASKASPKIWQNWDGFVANANKLKAGADKIDASSAQSIGATMGDAGGMCRTCHTEFRI